MSKELLEEIRHELVSIHGLHVFDKCASQLGYVEVFENDMWQLNYTDLIEKIDKELK